MALELCILASGSSGNASLLRTPAGCLLIDAGIGPRTTAQRLCGTGCAVNEIRAILLTHLDRDHFTPGWLATLAKQEIPLFIHHRRRDEFITLVHQAKPPGLHAARIAPLVRLFHHESFSPLPGLDVSPLPFAHDGAGSHGFVVSGFGGRLGYATDLGRVPDHLLEAFEDLDILAMESNYDAQMQLASSRPVFLKRRIMGGAGHLSNDQALAAIRRILDRHEANCAPLPSHVVLLHRSRQCNCPRLLSQLFNADPRLPPRLTLAHQHERTEWLRPRSVAPRPGEQLLLAM
jgi:phosphoribosyl 1,2-cyclic phosphodiesterase